MAKPSILDYFHMEVSSADRFAGILAQMEKDEADWPFEIAEGIPRDPAGLAMYLGGTVAGTSVEVLDAPAPEPLAEGTVTWPDGSINDAAYLPEPPPPEGGEGNTTVTGSSL